MEFAVCNEQAEKYIKIITAHVRPVGGRKYAASTQCNRALEMMKWIKMTHKFPIKEHPYGKALMKFLNHLKHDQVSKAEILPYETIVDKFSTVSDDERMIHLMQVAFMTAARISHLPWLIFRGQAVTGLRFTWKYHKSFASRGPLEVVIPHHCIPSELDLSALTIGSPVCTEGEMLSLYDLLLKALKGRTYTIRRSSANHMRYVLGMSPEETILITLHASIETLNTYLVTNGRQDTEDS